MAATVLVLFLLVLITPRLTGIQEDISSLPRLILNYDEEEEGMVLYLTSLAGTYLYRNLYLNITPGVGDFPLLRNVSNSHGLELGVHLAGLSGTFHVMPVSFIVEAAAIDKRSVVFDLTLHVTATPEVEEGVTRGWRFELLFGEEIQPRIVTHQDLLNSPIATLLQRRDES